MSEYLGKIERDKQEKTLFDESFIIGNITDEKKQEMKTILKKEKRGYIV